VDYSFLAYGVGIRSAIPIASLWSAAPDSAPFTVQFEIGPEPEWVKAALALPGRVLSLQPEDKTTADPSFTVTEYGDGTCHELAYSDGARFVFNQTSDRLWAVAKPPLTADELYLYLVGPVMGFLLRHWHVTCLHASAVELHDHAVLFCGDAGYGKSTTAAALALRGVPVLAEDIVPLELTKDRDRYRAVPGYPRICLWPDAVTNLLGDGNDLPRLLPNWEKRYLPLDGVRAKFAAAKKPVGIIYLFGPPSKDSRAPFIEELCARDAVLGLVQNTYMNWLLDRERRGEEFDELCRIVQQVPVRRVTARGEGVKLDALCERIFDDARNTLGKPEPVAARAQRL
jgi:hypothetical protein